SENSLPGAGAVDGVDVAEDEEIGPFGGAEVASREKRDQAEKSGKSCPHRTWGRSVAGAGHTIPDPPRAIPERQGHAERYGKDQARRIDSHHRPSACLLGVSDHRRRTPPGFPT